MGKTCRSAVWSGAALLLAMLLAVGCGRMGYSLSPEEQLDGAVGQDATSKAYDAALAGLCFDGIQNNSESGVDCGGTCDACASFACADTIPDNECAALEAFYVAANGDNWDDHSGWLVDVDPCTWQGITCAAGHVTEVVIEDDALGGTLSRQIANLRRLTRLRLRTRRCCIWNTLLSGPIPPELGSLTELVHLELAYQQLSGSIPPELGNLVNLEYLGLDDNQLTGSIPAELGNLTRLIEMSIDDNQLTGSIPEELGTLSSMTTLHLEENQLTGSIPGAFGSLSSLAYVYLEDNQLSGSIPPQLGSLTNMNVMSLSDNALSGSIPVELGNMTNCTFLWAARNNLSGEVPAELMDTSIVINAGLRINGQAGCLTASPLMTFWLEARDSSWNDGC